MWKWLQVNFCPWSIVYDLRTSIAEQETLGFQAGCPDYSSGDQCVGTVKRLKGEEKGWETYSAFFSSGRGEIKSDRPELTWAQFHGAAKHKFLLSLKMLCLANKGYQPKFSAMFIST